MQTAADREPTDRELIARFVRETDREAFAEIVRRWDGRIFGFLAKAAADRDAAEDLRQEVFVKVYRHASAYDPRYAFSTWLFRIASNALSTWKAAESRRAAIRSLDDPEPSFPEPADASPSPRELAASAEMAGEVHRVLATLEPKDRALLLLRFDRDLTYREIAQIQGEPETTIKSRLYKLLGDLRRRMAGASERVGGE